MVERYVGAHCLLTAAALLLLDLAIIEDAAATRSISLNRTTTFITEIIAYTDARAENLGIVTHYPNFRCYKLFHICKPFYLQ